MVFNKSACIIRKLYCGEGKVPKDTHSTKYSRQGTAYECLKKGFGIADWNHRKKDLSENSLQQIMYVGPVYEANFKKKRVYTIPSLLKKVRDMTSAEKKTLITSCCKRKNGSVDQKAVNSILLFLHNRGISDLPACKIVRE